MSDVYEQHRKHFDSVAAYVVVGTNSKGEPDRKATIAFRYPRDGMGRQWCYLHVFGGAMVRGYASGCGYDKHSASASAAARRISAKDYYPESQADVAAIVAALIPDDGHSWEKRLRDAGYHVFQAV